MKQNNSYEIRIALLEQTCSNINQTLIRLEKKMDDGFSRIDSQLYILDKKIDSKFELIDKKIDSIHSRIWHLFLCGVGAFAGMLTLIAHAEKWI